MPSLHRRRGTPAWVAFSTMLLAASPGWCYESNGLPLQLIDDVEVASLDPGIAEQVLVRPGDTVRQGDTLVKLDYDLYSAQAKVAEMAWLAAKSEAENDVNRRFSVKTLRVNEKVLQKSLDAVGEYAKSITDTEIERLRLERDQAELSIEQAEVEQQTAAYRASLRQAELSLAKIKLARRNVLSPLDGVVVAVKVGAGEAVRSAEPVVRVVSIKRLRAIATVGRELAQKIRPDDPAQFRIVLDGVPRRLPARITYVSPEIRYTEQAFDVWAEIENPEGLLLPGMKGDLLFGPNVHQAAGEQVATTAHGP